MERLRRRAGLKFRPTASLAPFLSAEWMRAATKSHTPRSTTSSSEKTGNRNALPLDGGRKGIRSGLTRAPWLLKYFGCCQLAGGLLGGNRGRGLRFRGGARAHLITRGLEIGQQGVENDHRRFRAPTFQFRFAPVAIQSDRSGDVFGKRLAVVAFTDEDIADLTASVHFIDSPAGLAAAVGEGEVDFAGVAVVFAVVPGLRSVNFGMVPAWTMRARHLVHQLVLGIEIEDALAGVADDGVLAGADVVISLRPQHDLAGHAFLVAHLGNSAAPELGNALVLAEKVFADAAEKLIPLGAPLRKKLFILGRPLTGLLFFLLDFRGFGFQFGLRGLDFLVAGIGIDHEFEDFVLGGRDFFLSKLNLAEQRLVLFVGFHIERLVAILRDLAAQIGNRAVVLAAGGLVGLDGGLGFFELGFGSGEFLLDHRDPFRQFGDLVLQAADFLVRILQLQQIFDVRKHSSSVRSYFSTRNAAKTRGLA